MIPFLASALISAGASIFGRRQEDQQAERNTAAGNAAARQNNDIAWRRNQQASRQANRWSERQILKAERRTDQNRDQANRFNVRQNRLAERRNDQNVRQAEARNDQNVRQANRFNVRQNRLAEKRSDKNALQAFNRSQRSADKAMEFTDAQADQAARRTNRDALRNREWALEDKAQLDEQARNQYVDLRNAAVKGGFNPLSVLGTQMTPMGAGGLSSSSYGAAGGVSAQAGFSPSGSVQSGSMSSGLIPTGVVSSGFSPSGYATASVPMAGTPDTFVQPLTSNAGVVGAISELGAEWTGMNAVAREQDQLYADLARIQLDQARSGVASYPSAPQGSLPNMGSTAVPVGSMSGSSPFDGFDEGYAPIYEGESTVGNLGAETQPDTIGTGMGLLSNSWLPGSQERPYAVFGDTEEALQTENMIPNGLLIGAQMFNRYGVPLYNQFRGAAAAAGQRVDQMLFPENVQDVTPVPFNQGVVEYPRPEWYRPGNLSITVGGQ